MSRTIRNVPHGMGNTDWSFLPEKDRVRYETRDAKWARGQDGVVHSYCNDAHSSAPKGYLEADTVGRNSKASAKREAHRIIRNRGKKEIRSQLDDRYDA